MSPLPLPRPAGTTMGKGPVPRVTMGHKGQGTCCPHDPRPHSTQGPADGAGSALGSCGVTAEPRAPMCPQPPTVHGAEPLRATGSTHRSVASSVSAHQHGGSSGDVADPPLGSFTSLPYSNRGWSRVGPSLHAQPVAVSGRLFPGMAQPFPAGNQLFNANSDGVGRSTGKRGMGRQGQM